jgi:hypothetical protein
MQSEYLEKISPGATKRDDVVANEFRKGLVIVSGILMLTGCGMLWSAANDALIAVGAEDSPRINAANFFIFLMLIAWLGFAAQMSDLSEVKQLVWVSIGIISSTMVGWLNIGTHDRQLWFVDVSLGGLNELHQWAYNDKSDSVGNFRSFDIDRDVISMALAGVLLGWISMNMIFIAVYGARFREELRSRMPLVPMPLLEANRRVTNDIPLGRPLFLPVHTVNCMQTLKA